MITAHLCINGDQFVSKIKLKEWREEIKIPIVLPLKVQDWDSEDIKITASPCFVFEWRHQIGLLTHQYTLKEII